MGYRRNKIITLTFEDPEYAGLEVEARGASVGGILGVMDVVDVLDKPAAQRSIGDLRKIDRLFRALAGCPVACADEHEELPPGQDHYLNRIVGWNLTEEDEVAGDVAVPATYEGLVAQDFDFALSLAMAWLDGVVGTPGPLVPSSNDGGLPAGVSIPMETLSPGPPL